MSTFLTVVVVLVALAGAVTIVVEDPDQPATAHLRKVRERAGRLWRDLQHRSQRRTAPARPPAHRSPARPAAAPPPPPPASPASRPVGYAGAVAPTVSMRAGTAGPATAEMPRFTDGWQPSRPMPVWVRIRSGLTLAVLLTFTGAIIAASFAGVVIFVALAVRSAVK